MKKIFKYGMILSLGAMPLLTRAAQLSPAEALGRISSLSKARMLRAKTASVPALTVKASSDTSFAGLYVFAAERGYMVVSADDIAAPLLGYSESQTFDADRLPDGLRYWLQTLADEIQWAATHDLRPNMEMLNVAAARAERTPIPPLTLSKWNQASPYNADCPMDGDTRSVTGCVATAMAQTMYVHKYPSKGTGSNSYQWKGKTLEVDFGQTSYLWDDMTPTYDENSSPEARNAVANLMYSCGVAVNMDYSAKESGALGYEIGPALYTYFGYDISMAQPMRTFYTLSQWEELIYDQLRQGLPVLYGGQSSLGGHQFICDGYDDDGYFHFNWGWGGTSDGYFLLDALDPLEQGIGGSADQSGFNFMQNVVINVKPASPDSSPTFMICAYGDFIVFNEQFFNNEEFTANLGESVPVGTTSSGFINLGVDAVKGVYGVKITGADGSVSYLGARMAEATVPVLVEGGVSGFYIMLPADMAEGRYNLTPVFKIAGTSEWLDVPLVVSAARGLDVTVEGGKAHFEYADNPMLEITDLQFDGPLYIGQPFSCDITFLNDEDSEFYGEYVLGLMNQTATSLTVTATGDLVKGVIDVAPGESVTQTFRGSFPKNVGMGTLRPGQYYFLVIDAVTQNIISLYDQPVTVEAAPAGVEKDTLDSLDEAEDGTVYYNLQGQRVASPSRGTYIRISGGKAEKVIL